MADNEENKTPAEQIKFCKDCEFFLADTTHAKPLDNLRFGRCAKSVKSEDQKSYFVTGVLIVVPALERFNFACCERDDERTCGRVARWFQPKIL